MTLEDGIRPSQQGRVLAKDIWMLGIAAALILDRKTWNPAAGLLSARLFAQGPAIGFAINIRAQAVSNGAALPLREKRLRFAPGSAQVQAVDGM